jgi:type IV pilus assembly protein PilN
MRRINLLPPEERGRRLSLEAPGGILGIVLIAGAAVLLVLVGVYVFYLVRVNNQEEQIAQLDQQIAQQNSRIAELSPFRDLQSRLDAKKPVADGIFRSRFPWDEFLQGLAFVIPDTSSLDTLTAQASPIDIQAPVEQALSPPGAVTFTGVALPEYQNMSDLIISLNTLRFLSNTELTTAELDRETFVEPVLTFEVASELITTVGESGTEVRIEAPDPGEEPAEIEGDPASQSQYGGIP